MQKHVNLVDLVKSFPTNIFFAKFGVDKKGEKKQFGVDTEENELYKF